jgi:hypothetical protein
MAPQGFLNPVVSTITVLLLLSTMHSGNGPLTIIRAWKSPPKHIELAGRTLVCDERYAVPFRRILLVIQFTVRNPELEPLVEKLYSCFFPHIVRYTYCDPNPEVNANLSRTGTLCIPDPAPGFHI